MTQIWSHWGKNSWWKSRVGNHDRFRKLRFCRCNTVSPALSCSFLLFPALSRFHSLQLLTQKSKPSAIAFGFEIINDKLVTMANCLSWNFDCCCVTHTHTHACFGMCQLWPVPRKLVVPIVQKRSFFGKKKILEI